MKNKSEKFSIFNETLAKNLKFYRESNNYSVELLANVFSVKSSDVLAWEKGKIIPSLNTVIDLANLYKVPIDSLINLKNFGRTVTAQEPLNEGEMTVAEKELLLKFRRANEAWQEFVLFTADIGINKTSEDEEKFKLRSAHIQTLIEQGKI